mmetsp:Transcript_1333/g.2965  ORF Transcript_1333/g.2965 Transcript_1333/m.2965 type:complete len:387 (-) Transcript_1333:1305-2465(-)
MMFEVLMGTPFSSPMALASLPEKPTLKAMMQPWASSASLTSDSDTAPTEAEIMSTSMSTLVSSPSAWMLATMASRLPSQSALTTTLALGRSVSPSLSTLLSSLLSSGMKRRLNSRASFSPLNMATLAASILLLVRAAPPVSSSSILCGAALSSLWIFISSALLSATSFAIFSQLAIFISSPALGNPLSPTIRIGVLGPASFSGRPAGHFIALTLPLSTPATTASPTFTLPHLTTTSATTPRPLSTMASTTTPSPCASGSARNSITSACRTSASMSSGTPSPVMPLTGHICVSPPSPSVMTPNDASSLDIRVSASSRSTPGLSIFVMATTIACPPLSAVSITSFVCSFTPSSEATTRTTTSTLLAPFTRMDLNAAWPGVSRKQILPS